MLAWPSLRLRLWLVVWGCLALAATPGRGDEPAPRYSPTTDYTEESLLGWTVLVHKDLLADDALYTEVRDELHHQLYRVTRAIPQPALDKLRTTRIWVELNNPNPHFPCACYHSNRRWLEQNGVNPEKTGAIELANARNFVSWTHTQPWMMLHELTHAYHDQHLPDGYQNAAVVGAYERAKAGGLYTEVLRHNGTQTRHYALNNPMEYLAEATEAYFGQNDYYPFVRAELETYDPAGARLVRHVWGLDVLEPAEAVREGLPWDLAQLSKAPAHKWGEEKEGVRELYFYAEPYRGAERTEVFAYYATPGSLAGDPSLDRELPGIVLVHGGGGAAFPEWVKLWAQRGYAALALDLAGNGPDKKRLEQGGPNQGDAEKFGAIDEPLHNQWSYHAVANTILAHSLLRSFAEVNADRTALTGISWGGYVTNLVAGLDSRFKAAVPVYGCGFLHEGSTWDKQFAAMTDEQREKWVRLWDPGRYVAAAQPAMFFVNGTNDFAYWLPSYAKTYQQKQGERNLRITVRMPHGHEAGWAPEEIGLFVDQHLRDGEPLPKFDRPELREAGARAKVSGPQPLAGGEFHYTTARGKSPDLKWETRPAEMNDGVVSIAELPENVACWFFTAKDERGAIVSSELVFVDP